MSFEKIERRFIAWAETQPNVRAGCVLGSRARSVRPADEWSDLDIAVFARDADRLVLSTDWVAQMGEPVLTFVEDTPGGAARERRVLYEGGLDVDYAVFPARRLRLLARYVQARDKAPRVLSLAPASLRSSLEHAAWEFADVASRGVRVLLDRDGALTRLIQLVPMPPPATEPREPWFRERVEDFWYHALWAAKKLRRDEIFTAKACTDSYMKAQVLGMLELHARAGDSSVDTWHRGRFLEQWADPRALDQLRDAYSRYDADDVARGLLVTMELFRWVARETAERLGFAYPTASDEQATALVERYLAERPQR